MRMLESNLDEYGDLISDGGNRSDRSMQGSRNGSFSCDPEHSNIKDGELLETQEELLGVQVEEELNRSIEASRKQNETRTTKLISIESSSLSSTGGRGDSAGTQPRSAAVSAFLEDLEMPSFCSSYGEDSEEFVFKKGEISRKLSEGKSPSSSRKVLKAGEYSSKIRGESAFSILEDIEMPSFSSSVEDEQLIMIEKSAENLRFTMDVWSPVKDVEEPKDISDPVRSIENFLHGKMEHTLSSLEESKDINDPVRCIEKFLHGKVERTSTSPNETVETSVSDQTLFREAQNVVFQLEDYEEKQDPFKKTSSPNSLRVTLGRGFKELEMEELNDSLLASPQKFQQAITKRNLFSTLTSLPMLKVDEEEEFISEAEAVAARFETCENERAEESLHGKSLDRRFTLGEIKMLDLGDLDDDDDDLLTCLPPSPSPPPPFPSPLSDLQSYKKSTHCPISSLRTQEMLPPQSLPQRFTSVNQVTAKPNLNHNFGAEEREVTSKKPVGEAVVHLKERKSEGATCLNSTFDKDENYLKKSDISPSASPQKPLLDLDITFESVEPQVQGRKSLGDQLRMKRVATRLNSTFDTEDIEHKASVTSKGDEGISSTATTGTSNRATNSTFDKKTVPRDINSTFDKKTAPQDINSTFEKKTAPQYINSTFDKTVPQSTNSNFDKNTIPQGTNTTYDQNVAPEVVADGTFDVDDKPLENKAAPLLSETPTKGTLNLMDASQDELDASFCSTPAKGSSFQPINSTPVALSSTVTKDPRKSFLHRLSCNIRNQAASQGTTVTSNRQEEECGIEEQEVKEDAVQHQPAILSRLGSVTQGEVASRLLKMRRGPLRSLHGPLKVMHKDSEGSSGDVPSRGSVKSSIPSLGSLSSIETDGERPRHSFTPTDSPDLVFRVASSRGGQMMTSTPSHINPVIHPPVPCTPIVAPLPHGKVDITPLVPCNEDVFEEIGNQKDANPSPKAAIDNISPIAVNKVSVLNTSVDGISALKNFEDKGIPLNTTVDKVAPLNTTVDKIAPLNTVDEGAPLSTTVDKVAPLNTNVDVRAPLNNKVDKVIPLNTIVDEVVPVSTTVDRVAPTSTTVGEVTPLNTTVDKVSSNTSVDKVALPNTKMHKVTPLKSKLAKVSLLNTTRDKVSPINTRVHKVTSLNSEVGKISPLNTTKDKVPLPSNKVNVAPPNSAVHKESPHNTTFEKAAPLNTTLDRIIPLSTTVDEITPENITVGKEAPFKTAMDKEAPYNTPVDRVKPLNTIVDKATPLNNTVDKAPSVSTPGNKAPSLNTAVDSLLHRRTCEAPPLKTTLSNTKEPSNTVEDSVVSNVAEPLSTNGDNIAPPYNSVNNILPSLNTRGGNVAQLFCSPVGTISSGLDAVNREAQAVSDNVAVLTTTVDHCVPSHRTSASKSDMLPPVVTTDIVAPDLNTVVDDGKPLLFSIPVDTTVAPLNITMDTVETQVGTLVDKVTPDLTAAMDDVLSPLNIIVENEASQPVTTVDNVVTVINEVNNVETPISTILGSKTLPLSAVVDDVELPGKTSTGTVALPDNTFVETVGDPLGTREPAGCDNAHPVVTVKTLNENTSQVISAVDLAAVSSSLQPEIVVTDEVVKESESQVIGTIRGHLGLSSEEESQEEKLSSHQAEMTSGMREEGIRHEEENDYLSSVKCEDLIIKEKEPSEVLKVGDEARNLKIVESSESDERRGDWDAEMNKEESRTEGDDVEKEVVNMLDKKDIDMEEVAKEEPQRSCQNTPCGSADKLVHATGNKVMPDKRPPYTTSSASDKLKLPQELTQNKTRQAKQIKGSAPTLQKVSHLRTSIQPPSSRNIGKLGGSAVRASLSFAPASKVSGGYTVSSKIGTQTSAKLGDTQSGPGRLVMGSGTAGVRGSDSNLARKSMYVSKGGIGSAGNGKETLKAAVVQSSVKAKEGADVEAKKSYAGAKLTAVKKLSIAPRITSINTQIGKENCPTRMSLSSLKNPSKPVKTVVSGTGVQEAQRSVLQTRNGTPTIGTDAQKSSKISMSSGSRKTPVSAGLPDKKPSSENKDISTKKTPAKRIEPLSTGGIRTQRQRGMLGGTPRKYLASPMKPIETADAQRSVGDGLSQPPKEPLYPSSIKPSGLKVPQIRTSRIPAPVSKLRQPSSRIAIPTQSE